jgi:hypothetical protein
MISRSRSSLVALGAIALFTARDARAATVRDVNDAFAIDLDVPGMRTCVLFPEDPMRQRACDGLDLAALDEITKAQAGAVAAALVVGEGWGFEVVVRRAPSDGFAFDADSADAFARAARADVRGPSGAGLLGGGAAHGELVTTAPPLSIARAGFAATIGTEAPPVKRLLERQIVYGVAGSSSVFHVILACDADHVAEADRMIVAQLRSVKIQPPRPRVVQTILFGFYGGRIALALVAIVIAAVALLLARSRRARLKGVRGPAASGWPSIREEE